MTHRNRTPRLAFRLAAAALALGLAAPAAAQVPALINHQGRLANADGPVTGLVRMEFNLYDAAAAGNKIWGPQTFENVPVVGGRFNVLLGPNDSTTVTLTTALQGGLAFVGVKVAEPSQPFGAEMAPRQQLLSVPYAFRAFSAQNGDIGDILDEILARLDELEGVAGGRAAARTGADKPDQTKNSEPPRAPRAGEQPGDQP